MIDHPCFNCEKRHPRCHSECPEYMHRDPPKSEDIDYKAYTREKRAKKLKEKIIRRQYKAHKEY